MPSLSIPLAPLLGAAAIMIRVMFLLAFMPIIGDSFAPARIRVVFAVALTLLLVPIWGGTVRVFPSSIPGLAVAMLPEALIGAALGLLGRIMFAAVQFAGQLAGHEMGFSTANEIDPMSGIPDVVVGQMQYILAIAIFFFTAAHASFFNALSESFRLIPAFSANASESLLGLIRQASAQMFYLGVKINFPVLATLICVNVTFAMLAKAVPGLNVMIESFPVRIGAGMVVLTLSISFISVILRQSFGQLDQQLISAINALAPGK